MLNKPVAQFRDIAAYSGDWVEVKKGDLIRIIDVECQQVCDMFAVSSADKSEWLSPAHTRAGTSRLFPKVGQYFYTNRYRPILTMTEDNSPGVHDMLYRACDPFMYKELGVIGYHPNCNENFRKAAEEANWRPPEVPDPVNFFQNTPLNDQGELGIQPALSKAGDSVTLRAEMDLVMVVTACSFDIDFTAAGLPQGMDIVPISGERCTGIRIEVLSEPSTV